MKTWSLIRTLMVMTVVWTAVVGPAAWNAWQVLAAADGYVPARLVVTEVRGSQDAGWSLEGHVGDQEAALVPDGDGPWQVGEAVDVLFNANLPVNGVGGETLRAIAPREDLAADRRQELVELLRVPAVSLGGILVVFFLERWSRRRRPPRFDGSVAVAFPVKWAGMGAVLVPFGAALLLAQLPRTQVAGLVVGSVLVVLGLGALVGTWVEVDPSRRLTRGRHLLGWPLPGGHEMPSPRGLLVRPSAVARGDELVAETASGEGGGRVVLGRVFDSEQATAMAADLAKSLGVGFRRVAEEAEEEEDDPDEDDDS